MDNNDRVKSQKSKVKTDNGEKQLEEKKTEEELKKKIEDLDNKYKRALADYQNLEKRVAEERKEWILKANKDLLLHLLPVLDTLILAKKHVKVADEGLSLSIKQFQDLLSAEGVEKIDVVGKQFDPNIMQCVETQEDEEGKVLDEIRTGYKYKYDGTILREALVRVGKKRIEKKEEEKAKKGLWEK